MTKEKKQDDVEEMNLEDFLEEVDVNIKATENKFETIKKQYAALYNLYQKVFNHSKTNYLKCYYNHTLGSLYYELGDKKTIGFKQGGIKNG